MQAVTAALLSRLPCGLVRFFFIVAVNGVARAYFCGVRGVMLFDNNDPIPLESKTCQGRLRWQIRLFVDDLSGTS